MRPILFQADLKGSCYLGQLTRLGFEQHLRLGSLLRARYGGFLPSVFRRSDNVLKVRSTQYDRTIASAEALLTGLFPPEHRAWGEEGQIAIDIRHESRENMYPRPDACPALLAFFKKLNARRHFSFGPGKSFPAQELVTTADTLVLHGHPLPPGMDVYEIHRLAALDHAVVFGNSPASRLVIGNFLSELWSGLRDAAEPRLTVYSAHDTTLLPLLPLLGLLAPPGPGEGLKHPPCASALLLESYSDPATGAEYLGVLYNSRPLLLGRGIKPARGTLYRMQDVEEMLRPLFLSEEQVKTMCHQ